MTPPSPRQHEMHSADVATFTERISALKEQFDAHDERDMATQDMLFSKLESIQRLVWIAVGGVVVIGALVSLVGGSIMKLLAH